MRQLSLVLAALFAFCFGSAGVSPTVLDSLGYPWPHSAISSLAAIRHPAASLTTICHPERSEGSVFRKEFS